MSAVATSATRDPRAVLNWCRDVVDGPLRDAVADLPSAANRIANYHFGWADAEGRPVTSGGGKAIRPALTLLCCQVAGGDYLDAVPAAVAVELVHNFSLLHDDVMDHDPLRRHRPTAWTVFGVNESVLAGDALLALAASVITDNPRPVTAGKWLARSVMDLCQGQSEDLAFETAQDVTTAQCTTMAHNKTGALLAVSCALGGLSAGASDDDCQLLSKFGAHIGLAFQLVDDLLGIWGSPQETGKPVYSDLTNRKRSLPVVAALRSGTAAGAEFAQLYASQVELGSDELAHAAHLIVAAGGRNWVTQLADAAVGEAVHCLDAVSVNADARAKLLALAQFVTARDR